jgi:hypothetical protein
MTAEARLVHEECWLLLPWLANGRLSAAERSRVEEHVFECMHCAREVAWQRAAVQAFGEPDRVSYAPGPSFRKLMERIDNRQTGPVTRPRIPGRARTDREALWRPPGLAWAAGFVLALALGALAPLAYHWSKPAYGVLTTDPPAATVSRGVLHVAFARSLTIGEVDELLRSAGAKVVEGPGSSGIFGVAPLGGATQRVAGGVSPQMRALATRLQTDPRVRWVEPLAAGDSLEGAEQPRALSR